MCQRITARMAATPRSVHIARSFVADQLDGWGATTTDSAYGRIADAVLIVSELVANAVKFCTHEVELLLVAHRDRIEIAVTDDNPEPAVLKRPDPHAPGGRGLLLVNALAEQWGQQQHQGRKTVWVLLSIPPGSALADNCSEPNG